MVLPEHKTIVRNSQRRSGCSCRPIIQVNRRFIDILIHRADNIKGKLLSFALLVVILQGGFHCAIECAAASTVGINSGSHAEFQIQCVGAKRDGIYTGQISFLAALLTSDRVACALILIINPDPTNILYDPFLRDAAAIVPTDTNLSNVQFIVRIAILGNIIGNDMNRNQFAIVIIGRYDKALRTAGSETVSAQLLIGQNIAADTIFKLQQEIESILRSIVAIVIQQRSCSTLNLHFNRIIFPDFCQAQIRGALIVGHGITILTPVKVINLLDTLGDKINNTTVTGLNQCLFFHRKDCITFGISIISSVGHCAIGNHIFPNTEPLIQAIQSNHMETVHLPVITTIGDRYS